MKRILFITALILGSCGYAQIPGYKGKKFVVSGEYLTFTSLLEYNKNFGKGITSLRSISGVTCDYVISRSVSFGVGVNFYKTGLLHESYVKEFYGPDTYDYTSYSTNTFYHLSGKEINVYWKFFSYRSRGSLAPLGFYNQLGLHGGILENKLVAGYQAEEDKNAKVSYGMVSYTIGFRNIYFRRLVTDFGIRCALPVFSDIMKSAGIINDYSYDGYGTNELEVDMGKRLLGQQVFNVKLGVGLLF